MMVIILAVTTMLSSCEKGEYQAENMLVGKWLASDYHAGDSDIIIFTEDFYAREYFRHILGNQIMPALYSEYVTYSFSSKRITFTLHYFYPEARKIEETYKYVFSKNSLTIKGFSNPFCATQEARTDVHFTKID